ncbi:MAG: response regulator transcription factor [Campylobacterota bacterium]
MINSKELLGYTQNLSILFVEDHDELRMNTDSILKNFFKEVASAQNGQEALKSYLNYTKENDGKYYDIVLTDIKMPKMDGVELTKHIYETNPSQALIVLSAFDDSKYLLPLINLGIEQFLKKPLDFQELLEILLRTSKKITNTVPKNHSSTIKIDESFTYDRDSKSLLNDKSNVYLTKYEILFIQQLTTNLGKIYSSEDIVNNYLSLGENIDAQNIRKLVSKLRKKLPEDSLESIYGVGYRFIPFYD